MKWIRYVLGKIILFLDAVFSPKKVHRDQENQSEIEPDLKKLTLYQFNACPFCVKVRRALTRLNLQLEIRDTLQSQEHKEELLQGGGKPQVPCLKIEKDNDQEEWLYESGAIIEYLESKFPVKS